MALNYSRTGKELTNVQMLTRQIDMYVKSNMPNAIYITELCNDACSLEVISGMISPNRVKPISKDLIATLSYSYLAFHDALFFNEFIEGYSSRAYIERFWWLAKRLPKRFDLLDIYFLDKEEDADKFYDTVIAKNNEGVVFKQLDYKMSDWKAGHKGYRMMKRVRGVSYDLRCIDIEEGKGKYAGKVTNLIFRWKNDKTIKAMLGKGWTHKDAEDMLYDPDVIGQIFEVHALQESSKGKLRLPKVGERRHDKCRPDV